VIAVTDAGPLHYLILIGHADVLPALFERVFIPDSVIEELQQAGTPDDVKNWIGCLPSWLQHAEHSSNAEPFPHLSISRLHRGEADAIRLAVRIQARVILLDDLAARTVATGAGLTPLDTLRVLAEGARLGLVSLPNAFERLQRTNFRANPRFYAGILDEFETR
jgi:predicted nucleic acid-binding protein